MADVNDVLAANRAAFMDLLAAAERSAATWTTPRATHDRILRASTIGSATGSSSSRQKSHAAPALFPGPVGRIVVTKVFRQMPVATADATRVALHLS